MEAVRVNSEGDASDGVNLHVTNSTILSTEPIMRMRERLQALKGLQMKTSDLESLFFNELHALEQRYSADFTKIFEERSGIITGAREPLVSCVEICPRKIVAYNLLQLIGTYLPNF